MLPLLLLLLFVGEDWGGGELIVFLTLIDTAWWGCCCCCKHNDDNNLLYLTHVLILRFWVSLILNQTKWHLQDIHSSHKLTSINRALFQSYLIYVGNVYRPYSWAIGPLFELGPNSKLGPNSELPYIPN